MAPVLSTEEYRFLIADALQGAQDADTAEPTMSTLFTPDGHRQALDPDATIVRGGRGVGKTFWFRSLLDARLREVVAREYEIPRLNRLEVVAGYGAAMAPDSYPGSAELRSLVDDKVSPRDLWNAILLVALGLPEFRAIESWRGRISWLRAHPSDRDRLISAVDRQAQVGNRQRLILFDALEHLHRDRREADRLVAGILELALELRLSTRNIRFKVFIRPDMFDGARRDFPDASKLAANAASLRWTTPNLYGLLFHHLGNTSAAAAQRFRVEGWDEPTPGRFLPPPSLLGDEERQADLFTEIAGPYMGANFRKGHTYTWLPNHLMDGAEQVSPRSFLSALAKAVEETTAHYAGYEFPVHHEGIRRGVQAASSTRVAEIREDMPWVDDAIRPLEGQQVPIEQAMVIDLWNKARLTETLERQAQYPGGDERDRTGPRNRENYPDLVEELIELGVMRRRKDDRLDLPDVYRIAFSVGRKGGVPKVKT